MVNERHAFHVAWNALLSQPTNGEDLVQLLELEKLIDTKFDLKSGKITRWIEASN